jgi:hypothetical protein
MNEGLHVVSRAVTTMHAIGQYGFVLAKHL